MHIFVPALPKAAHALDASMGSMQLTMSVHILGLAFGAVRLRGAVRPLRRAGLVLYAAAGLAAALVPDVPA